MDPFRPFAVFSPQISIEFSQFSTLLQVFAINVFRFSRVRFPASASFSLDVEINSQIFINESGFGQLLLELILYFQIIGVDMITSSKLIEYCCIISLKCRNALTESTVLDRRRAYLTRKDLFANPRRHLHQSMKY